MTPASAGAGISSDGRALPSVRVERAFDEQEVAECIAEADAAIMRKHSPAGRASMLYAASLALLAGVIVLWRRGSAAHRRRAAARPQRTAAGL